MMSSVTLAEIEKLTTQLSSSKEPASILLKRAKVFWQIDKRDLAIQDVLCGLQINPKDGKLIDAFQKMRDGKWQNTSEFDPLKALDVDWSKETFSKGMERLEKVVAYVVHEGGNQRIGMNILNSLEKVLLSEWNFEEKQKFASKCWFAVATLLKNENEVDDLLEAMLKEPLILKFSQLGLDNKSKEDYVLRNLGCYATALSISKQTHDNVYPTIKTWVEAIVQRSPKISQASLLLLFHLIERLSPEFVIKEWTVLLKRLSLLVILNYFENISNVLAAIFNQLFTLLADRNVEIQTKVLEIYQYLKYAKESSLITPIRFLICVCSTSEGLKVAAHILNKEGVLNEILEILDTDSFTKTALELVSKACNDGDLRSRLVESNELMSFCKHRVSRSCHSKEEREVKALASLCLSKLLFQKGQVNDAEYDELLLFDMFRSILVDSEKVHEDVANILEGLSYVLLKKPEIKHSVAFDKELLAKLCKLLKSHTDAALPIISIFKRVVSFRKILSEEEQQLTKLHTMAKQKVDDSNEDPMNSDDKVKERIQEIVNSTCVESVVNFFWIKSETKKTNTTIQTAVEFFHDVSCLASIRGRIIQSGTVPLLVQICNQNKNDKLEESALFVKAAHTIAKLFISVNPSLVFSSSNRSKISPSEVAAHLLQLLGPTLNSLIHFESLLSLTNLASEDSNVRKRILSNISFIEMHLLSDHPRIQCAAMECLCNLTFEHSVFEFYVKDCDRVLASVSSETTINTHTHGKLALFVALCGSEEFSTKRAASGGLAILSSSNIVCKWLLAFKQGKGMDYIFDLLKENNQELIHRALEVIKNCAKIDKSCKERLERSDFPKKCPSALKDILREAME